MPKDESAERGILAQENHLPGILGGIPTLQL